MISIDKAEIRNQKIGPWAASGEDSSIGLGSVSYTGSASGCVTLALSFSTDRLAHGAAELPDIISLLSENFCDGAYILRVYDADCERLRFGFLAHVCDELGNSHRLIASVFSKAT